MALYVTDLLMTVLALVIARWLRITLPWGRAVDAAGLAIHLQMLIAAVVIWSITLAALHAYDLQRLTHTVDEMQTVIVAIGIAVLLFSGTLYFTYRGLSRLLFLYFAVLDVILILSTRMVLRGLFSQDRSVRRRGVLIIGAGNTAQRVARSLQPCEWMGIEIRGYLDDEETLLGREIEGYPVLGTLAVAREVVQRERVQEVIIALPMSAHDVAVDLLSRLSDAPVNIKIVPDYSDLVHLRASVEQLGGVTFMGIKEPVIGPIDRVIKRCFDIGVAAFALLVLSPLFGVLALCIILTSPGPVFYHSRRVGEGEEPFFMLKFRTMYRDADKHESDLVRATEDGKLIFDKRRDDPRITPIGRFLRRYSLDELPQLYNVLIGEMSLVGPRPELPSLVAHYEPWQRKRFSVPQGITGWWQISGRGDKPKYLHAEDDLYYIQNYSLLLDVRILWKTLGAVIKGEGAY